jgi:hypothetical protein
VALQSYDPDDPTSLPLLILRTVTVCVMLAMSLTDNFLTGAGFGVYLNNRTWIEGWDVELAFKRLARRLTGSVLLWVALWALCMPAVSRAAVVRDPAQVIREVKTDAAFKVHTIIERIPNPSKRSWSWHWPQWLNPGTAPDWLGSVFMIAIMTAMAGAILWLLWKNRHVFLKIRMPAGLSPRAATARVVMGMEVSPETLPDDVPGAAWSLWRQGLRQQALGLLYRGAISRVMVAGRVEILESDTEGDCLRRVDLAGTPAYPEYFRRLTGVWIRLAYAGHGPEDREVESLCQQWPFADRRDV